MSRKSMIRLAVSLFVVLGAGAAAFLLTQQRLPSDLRAAVPQDALAIVHLRPGELLETKAFDQLVRQRGLDAGMRKVEEICGVNPVAEVDEAMIFAFPVGDDSWPAWGAVLRTDLDPRGLADCVKDTLEANGRTAELEQAEMHGIPCAVSSKGDSRACAVWHGLIVGSEAAVEGSIAAMLGKGPSVLGRPALSEPWDALSEDADVRAAGSIPKSTRKVLQAVVRPFLPASLEGLTKLEGMSGELDAGGDSLLGEARFQTASTEDAKAVAQAFEVVLSRLRDSAAIVLTPARTLLRQTKVETDGLRVRVTGDYPLHALGTVLDLVPVASRVLGLGALGNAVAAPAPPRASPGATPLAPAKKDAGTPPPATQPPATTPTPTTPAP